MRIADLHTYLNKISVFYFPGNAGYWNSLTRCRITQKPKDLGDYYLDFSSKANYPDEISVNGIPLFIHRDQPKIEHPIVIAQYALGLYSIIDANRSTAQEIKNKFLIQADWFVNNKVNIFDGVGWYINNLYPHYGLNSPWISSMAQGEAISVLTRAAKLSGKELYENTAIQALVPFEHNVADGGVINYFKSYLIYEEFPTPLRPMAVLNGFIFSLFGLYDLWLLNGNVKAKLLFEKGTESLKNLLPYYDLKLWTQYYLFDYPKKYFSSFTYHILVTEQLKALYLLTGDEYFFKYFNKWDRDSRNPIKKNIALFKKIISSNKIFPNKG